MISSSTLPHCKSRYRVGWHCSTILRECWIVRGVVLDRIVKPTSRLPIQVDIIISWYHSIKQRSFSLVLENKILQLNLSFNSWWLAGYCCCLQIGSCVCQQTVLILKSNYWRCVNVIKFLVVKFQLSRKCCNSLMRDCPTVLFTKPYGTKLIKYSDN